MTTRLREGDFLGDYRIEELLARGGMGLVYAARHVGLGRRAAIKVVAPHLADDPAFAARFRRESRLAATLDHPNVVPVYEAGECDGRLFIAMRFVEGVDLRSLLGVEGRLPPERAVRIVEQVAAALDAAHAAGLVHRDVKPSNVLLPNDPPDHAYLTDFGISSRTSGTATTATAGGGITGSVDYLAPEQILGETADHRVDVYSLGCLAFEILTGRPPFRRDTPAATLGAHLHAPVPRPSEAVPGIPPALDAPVMRALAKDPEERWASAGAFAAALADALAPRATRRRARPRRSAARPRRRPAARRDLIAAAVLSLLLAGVAFALASSADRAPANDPATGPRTYSDAFWGVSFRYPRTWRERSLALPGIGGVGDGDVHCNIFDEPGVRAPRDEDGLIERARRRAMRLRARLGGHLRELSRLDRPGATGLELVLDGRPHGAGGVHLAELFRASGALRFECAAPAARFARADADVFAPLLHSVRVGRKAA
jgi:predicted Ser/Thr protein kinase